MGREGEESGTTWGGREKRAGEAPVGAEEDGDAAAELGAVDEAVAVTVEEGVHHVPQQLLPVVGPGHVPVTCRSRAGHVPVTYPSRTRHDPGRTGRAR